MARVCVFLVKLKKTGHATVVCCFKRDGMQGRISSKKVLVDETDDKIDIQDERVTVHLCLIL